MERNSEVLEMNDLQERERTLAEEVEELRKAMRQLGRALLGEKKGEMLSSKQLLLRMLCVYWPLALVWLYIVYIAFLFR